MAKQTINLGTGELTGDGESIRSAFDKINSNFDELYTQDANDVVLSAINGHIIPDTDVAYDLGSASNRFRDLYLSGSTIDLGGTTLSVVGGDLQFGGIKIPTQTDLDTVASVSGDYNNLTNTPDLSNYVTQADLAAGSITVDVNNTGDLTGSVYGDDSMLLVDGANSKIVGPIEAPSIVSASYIDAATGVNASGFGSSTPGNFINLGVNASSINVVTDIDMLTNNISNASNITTGDLGVDNGISTTTITSAYYLGPTGSTMYLGGGANYTILQSDIWTSQPAKLIDSATGTITSDLVQAENITVGASGGINMQGADISAAGTIGATTVNAVNFNGNLNGSLTTENISHPSDDGLGLRLNSTDQSTLLVAKQSFDRTFDVDFEAGYTFSMLNTPNRVRVTFDENNGLNFRGLLNRWTILFDDIKFGDPIDFEYDYSNIRLSLEPDAYDIVTNVVDVTFVSDDVYDIEIDQDPITILAGLTGNPVGEVELDQIALRYDYNNTMGFDIERNRYGIAVDHDDIDLRAGKDIDLYATDDFRVRAGSSFNLSLESNDGRDDEHGININLYSYDAGNFIENNWTFQFDGNLRLPENGDIVDVNGNSVFDNITGLNNNNDINITINNDDSSTYTWNFTNEGRLTAPGDVTVSGITYTTQVKSNGQLLINAGGGPTNYVQIGTGSNVLIGQNGKNVEFGTSVTFPDATVQTTAYPGTPTLISSGDTAPGSAVVAGETAINFNFSGSPSALIVEADAITIGSGVTVTGLTGFSTLSDDITIDAGAAASITLGATGSGISIGSLDGVNINNTGVGTINIGHSTNQTNFAGTVDFSSATVTGFPALYNNGGVAYQFGYDDHNAVAPTSFGDFTVDSTLLSISHTATANAQGARVEVSGVTFGTSPGTGLIYVQRRVNGGSWTVWSAFVVKGGGDHFSHSFIDFYDTGGTSLDVSPGDTVEYKLTNGTQDTNYTGNSSGTVEFELFFGFQFTATEVTLSYSLTQP